MLRSIAVMWEGGQACGEVEVHRGRLRRLGVSEGSGEAEGNRFRLEAAGQARLLLDIEFSEDAEASRVVVSIAAENHRFGFFAEHANRISPIYIPAYGVIVTEAEDGRSFEDIRLNIRGKGRKTRLEHIESEPEESYEAAAAATKELACHTWLGLSRDTRIFGVGFRGVGGEERLWDWVQPRFHGQEAVLPENGDRPVRYRFLLGRGVGCVDPVERRLERGVLPILRAAITDDEVVYDCTSFVSHEYRPLNERTLRGTHYLVADSQSGGFMQTDEQARRRGLVEPEELERDEETVFYFRAVATNTADVPRYAWFKNVIPNAEMLNNNKNYDFDGRNGFVRFSPDRVCCVSFLNGKRLAEEETAVLLQPGERAEFRFYLPHRPISHDRATALAGQSYDSRLEECAAFWTGKLAAAATFTLPEARIGEMMAAGLLHLDLVSYGLEPDGTLHPTIGVYPAIGSESAPIIQFMDSMGWSETARRSLCYFLDKQHDNGFMQNFGGYMLETGAVLWSIGEHYRYTRDAEWIRSIMPKLLLSFDYLREWKKRNEQERLRGQGYGMLDGKAADPEDPFRSYMLNGYAYLGLSRLAEMAAELEHPDAERILLEAEELRRHIRDSFEEDLGRSPVVPIGDGTWVPTAPPWAGTRGPVSLFAEPGKAVSHASFFIRDSVLGPLYLVFQEVLRPDEDGATFMLQYHNELMCTRNVAFSQPYYSIHPWIHLKRGEVKAFLKAYYNGFAGLADRETYTFWEHYWHASPHKTHEEGWFLMQTRWMLYMEEGRRIRLLPGVPRAWLEDGKRIEWEGAASYFGPFDFSLESMAGQGRIGASVTFDPDRGPQEVLLRVPHPEGLKPVRVTGGSYDEEKECVLLKPVNGKARAFLYYG